MKFPNNIILDVSNTKMSYSSQYWVYRFLINFKTNNFDFNTFTAHRPFLLKKENLLLNKILKKQKKFTVKYSGSNPSIFLSKEKKEIFNKLFKTPEKVKHHLLFSKHWTKVIYDYLNTKEKFDVKTMSRMFRDFSFKDKNQIFKADNLWNLFDINFIKKEKIYTKLKYSRVPQYDIVSGGVAAIFAGFLGFLICEKFGFELLDSGDFYILFMYLVFISFFLRFFVKLVNFEHFSWNFVSLKWFLTYYKSIFYLLINFFK